MKTILKIPFINGNIYVGTPSIFGGMKKHTPNPDLVLIGERMRELRIAKGYTNYEYFAFENDIPRTQYGRYEKGQDMRLSSFFKVIRALEVTPEEFFSKGFEILAEEISN